MNSEQGAALAARIVRGALVTVRDDNGAQVTGRALKHVPGEGYRIEVGRGRFTYANANNVIRVDVPC